MLFWSARPRKEIIKSLIYVPMYAPSSWSFPLIAACNEPEYSILANHNKLGAHNLTATCFDVLQDVALPRYEVLL